MAQTANAQKMPVVRIINDIKNIVPISESLQTKGMVGKFEIKESKGDDKRTFAQFELQDRSGTIPCKIWDKSLEKIDKTVLEYIQSAPEKEPAIVAIYGNKAEFKGAYIDVIAMKLRTKDKAINYIHSSALNADEMYDYILQYAKSIKKPFSEILVDKLTENKKAFMDSPAAKKYHDNFANGLCEHTYKMLKGYAGLKDLYPKINSDIMIYLIIEHDFEKINGYTLLPSIEWTAQEELVGHSVMGAITVYNELSRHKVKDTTILAILNAMISHHNKPEWGAAKPAVTPEAKLLCDLDGMISDASRTEQAITDKNFKEGKIESDIYYVKYE